MITFDNTTELQERLKAALDRASHFENLAAELADKAQSEKLELIRALENANESLKLSADYLKAFNVPNAYHSVKSAIQFSENCVAKAKGTK
jgi:uncharacterized coiled-coil DUF342 family protein